MFEIMIIGFACISIAAFTVTNNEHKKEHVQIQRETDTGH